MNEHVCIRCGSEDTLNDLFFAPRIAARFRTTDLEERFALCRGCASTFTQSINSYFVFCHQCRLCFDKRDPAACRCPYCEICMHCEPNHFCDRMFFRKLDVDIPFFEHPNRLVGVELEVVEQNKSSDYRRIHRKKISEELDKSLAIQHDGSVNGDFDDGFEVITPPLRILDPAFPALITKTVATLKKHGCSVNDTCGMHVHFDASDIQSSPERLAHVLRTIYAVEDMLFSMNPPSRWKNTYCLPLSANYLFEDFDRPMPREKFEQYWYTVNEYRYAVLTKESINRFKSSKYGHAKYSGVNFHSLLYRGTIEFRHHAGTLQDEKILHWVTFLHRLIEYGCYEYVDSDVLALYILPTSDTKLNLMIDVLHIPEATAAYMKERVKKFNTGFKAFQRNQQKESKKTRKRIFDDSPDQRRRHMRSDLSSSPGNMWYTTSGEIPSTSLSLYQLNVFNAPTEQRRQNESAAQEQQSADALQAMINHYSEISSRTRR